MGEWRKEGREGGRDEEGREEGKEGVGGRATCQYNGGLHAHVHICTCACSPPIY